MKEELGNAVCEPHKQASNEKNLNEDFPKDVYHATKQDDCPRKWHWREGWGLGTSSEVAHTHLPAHKHVIPGFKKYQ